MEDETQPPRNLKQPLHLPEGREDMEKGVREEVGVVVEEEDNAPPSISESRGFSIRVVENRGQPLACAPAAIRSPASVDFRARSPAHIGIQVRAPTCPVREGRSGTMARDGLRPASLSKGALTASTQGKRIRSVCYKYCEEAKDCNRLLESERLSGGTYLSNGPARGSSRSVEPKGRSIQGRYQRRVLSLAYPSLRLRMPRIPGRQGVYLPLYLSYGLSIAPWFFTKAMKPVVGHMREQGHRIFSYLDDFFGAALSSQGRPTSAKDTKEFGDAMVALLERLGLLLHPRKCDFSGSTRLEILGIVLDTRKAMLLLSAAKLSKIELQARRLLRNASQHRRYVCVTDIRRFAGVGNSVSPAVVDAQLRRRELFDFTQVEPCHGHAPLHLTQKQGMSLTSRMTGYHTALRDVTDQSEAGSRHYHTGYGSVTEKSDLGSRHAPEHDLKFAMGSRRLSHAAMRDLQ